MQQNDTQNPAKASAPPDNDHAEPTTPGPAPVREWPNAEDLTEPEGQALQALRVWTRAQTNPALTAELDAWEWLRLAAFYAGGGKQKDLSDLADLAGDNAELAALAVIVAGFIGRETARMQASGNGRYKVGNPGV